MKSIPLNYLLPWSCKLSRAQNALASLCISVVIHKRARLLYLMSVSPGNNDDEGYIKLSMRS